MPPSQTYGNMLDITLLLEGSAAERINLPTPCLMISKVPIRF